MTALTRICLDYVPTIPMSKHENKTDKLFQNSALSLTESVYLRPRFHGHLFFDKVGLSQIDILVFIEFCVEVSSSNICDKGEPAK